MTLIAGGNEAIKWAGTWYENRQDHKRRSDLWFCVLPALYLLVPASKCCSRSLWNSSESEDHEHIDISRLDQLGSLAFTLIVIALGQVIGLRLGFFKCIREFIEGCSNTEKKSTTTTPLHPLKHPTESLSPGP